MRFLFALLLTVTAITSTQSAATADDLSDFMATVDADTMVMMPMRDGVRLQSDIYRPKGATGKLPVIFWKTPYNMNKLGGTVLKFAKQAIDHGYVFVHQNERGRYYSEGDWELLGNPSTDGYDALTWIAKQDWSTGKVGTIGCSSSAEWQLKLAAQNHPAHTAMIPMASGAGIGKVGRYQEQGNWYKGGVHQTLFSTWLYSVQQQDYPRFPPGMKQEDLQRLRKIYDLSPSMPKVDWPTHIKSLPMVDWLESAGGNTSPFKSLMTRTPNHPDWFKGGLYHDTMEFGVPAYWFNSWYDVSQGPNIETFNHIRKTAKDQRVRDGQYMVIAPTLHCGFYRIPKGDLIVGERNMGDANFPTDLFNMIFTFFDSYLKEGEAKKREAIPRVHYYTIGENKWKTAEQWPPKSAEGQTFYLSSNGGANSLYGDGRLVKKAPPKQTTDAYVYDPMNPVPALGGSVCCNAGMSKGGVYDQRAIEARADVLVYTSPPLTKDTTVSGFIDATLYVSSDAKDTDFTVKLVDVHPDGTAYNVDDTIQRARWRDGYETPKMMQDGKIYRINFSPMSTSTLFKKGHRIRVEISSSKFPQYARNLNTGGDNVTETKAITANNSIHHGGDYPSSITLPIIP